MKMRERAEKLDDTRFFHYEGMYDKRCTDLLSRMYPNESEFEKLCKKQKIKNWSAFIANSLAADDKDIDCQMYEEMPVVLCEYAHCMGNSLENFKEYTDAFEQYPHMCGGFIWDFVDQSIHKREDGTECWLYGSDFDEKESPYGFRKKNAKGNDGAFCAIGSGVGGSLIGWMLAAVGYDATFSVAPEATKMAIYGFSFIVPLIAFVVMYVLVSRFDLEKKLPQMREEVAKRKQEAVK